MLDIVLRNLLKPLILTPISFFWQFGFPSYDKGVIHNFEENMAEKTHRAVIHTAPGGPLTVQDVPIPTPGPGSAVVQVLATQIITYTSEVLSGKRPYHMSFPLTPGASAIGRGMCRRAP